MELGRAFLYLSLSIYLEQAALLFAHFDTDSDAACRKCRPGGGATAPLLWRPGAGSPGTWLRYALGASRRAAHLTAQWGGLAVQPRGPAEVERSRGPQHPGDGLLSREEFVALLGLVAAKAGHTYTQEHLASMFTEADLDCNDVLDLNELLLLLRGDAVRLPGGAG